METNALVKIVEQSGLDKQKQDYLLEKFSDATLLAESWAAKAKEIVVTDESQTDVMKQAREGRLLLKDKRVEIEKTRKQLKDSSLKEGRAIDDIAKALTALIEPTEKYLDEQEKFAERAKAKREREIHIERSELIKPYIDPVILSGMFLGDMPQSQFDAFLVGYKTVYEKKVADEKKAEEDRIAQQKADEEAREAQRIENERLKREADEREKQFAEQNRKAELKKKAGMARQELLMEINVKLDFNSCADMEESVWVDFYEQKNKEYQAEQNRIWIEKMKQDKILKEQKEENERLGKELQAKKDAEQKELEEAEKLASAGDKEKIKDLIQRLNDFNFPEVKSKKAKAIVGNATDTLKNLIIIVTQSSTKL